MLKRVKITAVFLLSCHFLAASAVGVPSDMCPESEHQRQPGGRLLRPPRVTTLLLLTIAAELLALVASDAAQQKVLEQLAPTKLLKNFVCEYSSHAATTFLHELGHAIAARLLTRHRATIHLGSYEKKKPFINLGTIKIDGLDPMAGVTTGISPFGQCSMDTAGILLAGGCTAIVCHWFIKFLLILTKNWLSGDQRSLCNAFAIDPIVAEQLITMLWPLKVTETSLSDGGKLWQSCLGVNPKVINIASAGAPAVELAAEVALAYNMAEGQQPSAIDLLIIAFINQQLRGYLRFKL